jgi:hypothetical protein
MTFEPLHLSRGGTSVVLESQPHGLPALMYWAPDLGDLGPAGHRAEQHRTGVHREPGSMAPATA